MCQVQWKGSRPDGGRLLKRNQTIQLTQDPVTCTKRKGNTWGETQEECVFLGSKKNSRDLHGRKQLCLCCMEGRYNQPRQQILSSRREIDPVRIEWLNKVSGEPKKLNSAGFQQAQTQKQVTNKEKYN